MAQLTEDGRRIVDNLAQRHGVSSDAVMTLLYAVVAGHGTQAQFSHPELGGMGQWSQGGMIMVGDMFNNALKYRVDALCTELSGLVQNSQLFAAPAQSQSQSQSGGVSGVSLFVPGSFSSANWWPDELGVPGSTGAQNNLRYAFFPSTRRLAIDLGGAVTVYDTGDHQISGFSQQQSGDQSLTFTSQYGLVRVADLPVVGSAGSESAPAHDNTYSAPPEAETAPQPAWDSAADSNAAPPASQTAQNSAAGSDDIFAKIERLAELRDKGILTDQEFDAKKTDLLNRL
ncbi:MAG: SHOCT domain-containing protein [Rhodomicrobiaceae bacterium]